VRYAGNRSDNFVVGLTDTSPKDSPPTLWNYEICGQYPGAVAAGATVTLRCRDNLKPFRYVVVQFPGTDYLNVCEIQVLAERPGVYAACIACGSVQVTVGCPSLPLSVCLSCSRSTAAASCGWFATEHPVGAACKLSIDICCMLHAVIRAHQHMRVASC